jgi:hypothetical protein
MTRPRRGAEVFSVAIKRARLDEVVVYEVTESELVILERAGSDSVLLNVVIFLFSSATTLVVAMISTDMRSPIRELSTVFVLVAVAVGMFVAGLWWRGRASTATCAKAIRNRLPPDGVQETMPPTESTASGRTTRPADDGLIIASARYGAETNWIDVTAFLASQIRGKALTVPVTNEAFGGDPCPNLPKTLEVAYRHQGVAHSESAAEGSTLSLP